MKIGNLIVLGLAFLLLSTSRPRKSTTRIPLAAFLLIHTICGLRFLSSKWFAGNMAWHDTIVWAKAICPLQQSI